MCLCVQYRADTAGEQFWLTLGLLPLANYGIDGGERSMLGLRVDVRLEDTPSTVITQIASQHDYSPSTERMRAIRDGLRCSAKLAVYSDRMLLVLTRFARVAERLRYVGIVGCGVAVCYWCLHQCPIETDRRDRQCQANYYAGEGNEDHDAWPWVCAADVCIVVIT